MYKHCTCIKHLTGAGHYFIDAPNRSRNHFIMNFYMPEIETPTIPDTQRKKFQQIQKALDLGRVTHVTGHLKDLVQIKKNLFLNSMQYLRIVLCMGYYALLVPFRIAADEGGYKLVTHPVQVVICCTLLAISTIFQLLNVKSLWGVVNVKNNASFAVQTAETSMTVVLMIAYLYACIIQRHRFMNMFERFNTSLVPNQDTGPLSRKNDKIRFGVMVFSALCLLAMAVWACLGNKIYDDVDLIHWYYGVGTSALNLNDCAKYPFCYYSVGIITLILDQHKEIVRVYVDFLLWGCALSIYNIEVTTKAVLLENLEFEIKKGIDVFRVINHLIQELSHAMGSITVAYYMELIPYGVCIVVSFNGNYIEWHQLFFVVIKLGHILIAAEANANGNNLINNILANKISYNAENIGQTKKFQHITKTPIALFGMDFFEVTYRFLGTVGLSLVTYCFLFVELQKDDCHCTCGNQ